MVMFVVMVMVILMVMVICDGDKAIKKYQRSMRARLRLWAWMQVHELGVD
jgi:hypothetical protein